MLSAPSFRSALVFSINSLTMSGFSFTSFHLDEASLPVFLWLYTLVGAVVQKHHEMYFIYNYSHFQYSFCNQPVSFAQLENVKQTMEQQPHRTCERTKSKQKENQVTSHSH